MCLKSCIFSYNNLSPLNVYSSSIAIVEIETHPMDFELTDEMSQNE